MSESTVPRTSKDVQAEYNNLLFRVGVATRAIYEQERELKMLGESLDKLQVEYNTLATAERKAEAEAKAATAKAKEEATNA
jgi:hypothetical protein